MAVYHVRLTQNNIQKMKKDVPHTNTCHHCQRKKSKHDAKNGTNCGCEKITI